MQDQLEEHETGKEAAIQDGQLGLSVVEIKSMTETMATPLLQSSQVCT